MIYRLAIRFGRGFIAAVIKSLARKYKKNHCKHHDRTER